MKERTMKDRKRIRQSIGVSLYGMSIVLRNKGLRLTPVTLRRWERGETPPPEPARLAVWDETLDELRRATSTALRKVKKKAKKKETPVAAAS